MRCRRPHIDDSPLSHGDLRRWHSSTSCHPASSTHRHCVTALVVAMLPYICVFGNFWIYMTTIGRSQLRLLWSTAAHVVAPQQHVAVPGSGDQKPLHVQTSVHTMAPCKQIINIPILCVRVHARICICMHGLTLHDVVPTSSI